MRESLRSAEKKLVARLNDIKDGSQGPITSAAALDVASQSPARVVDAILFHGDGCYSIGTGEPFTVSEKMDNVLQAFLEQPAYSTEGLKAASGVDRAPACLRDIPQKHPALAPYITLPGGKSKAGYAVKIKRASNALKSVYNRFAVDSTVRAWTRTPLLTPQLCSTGSQPMMSHAELTSWNPRPKVCGFFCVRSEPGSLPCIGGQSGRR